MHNLTGLGTASLDVMGGLVTSVSAEDLPEGASPLCWDVDFIVGSVFTRAGLSSVYTYTNTFTITSVGINYGVATFVYAPSAKTPVVNESFLLSGFTGAASFLNGETVTVAFVEPSGNTFLADVTFPDLDTVTDQNATAASTTGNFVGPNIGSSATVVNSDGNPWTDPVGIIGDTVYATTTTGGDNTLVGNPTTAVNQSTNSQWLTPTNVLTTGSSFATVTLGTGGSSAPLLISGMNFSIPSDAVVLGIKTTLAAKTTGAAGSGSLSLQLATNGAGVGTPVDVPISSTITTFSQGSNAFQWGTTLTPTIVNGASFGVLLQAGQASGSGSFSVNHFTITLYYQTSSSSEVLKAEAFAFSIPSTSGISGFGVTFEAYTSETTKVTLQLLKNGLPVGTPEEQVLTSTPTIYTLGAKNDLWGDTWTFANVNSTQFGVQITASGTGMTLIRDLDIITYVTPGLANFNYIKSFIENSGQIDTLALDSSGILWRENVNDSLGTLAVALTGILPNSFAKSATALDQEYICFSDLSIGTDRPRVYNGSAFLPLSQVGPGAPPSFVSSVGTTGQQLAISAFSISGNIVTFTYTGTEPTVNDLYQISGAPSPFTYLNFTGTVLASGLSTTQFEMELVHPDVSSTSITATATLLFSYPIASITQPAANPKGAFIGYQWTAGPGQVAPGAILTIYYADTEDTTLTSAFNSGLYPVFVYIKNLQVNFNFTGTYQVTSVGRGIPAGHDTQHYFFTVNVGTAGSQSSSGGSPSGSYQQTLALLTMQVPVPGLVQGDTILITQATPSGWNSSWPIVNALKSGVLNITNTAMDATGTATYQFNVASGVAPSPNDIITISNCTNNAIFNTTGVIATVVGSSFTITGFNSGVIPAAFEAAGTGITFGKTFNIDPGAKTLGTATNPIFGNDTNTGIVTLNGGNTTPIGAGTRQAVVFFITESGFDTPPSAPVVFTTSSSANFINVASIPIGPPNVVARGIAFTEAGQNGVPGANFYVIENDVIITVGNSTTVYTSTIIRDNTSTTAKFTFTDAVLLNSTEIDVQGNDLFNLIELGSSAWCVPYASRMFYGLQLNKVQNFNNLSFDGGYLPNVNGNLAPLGWNISAGAIVNLLTSTVTGQSLYISNTTGATLPSAGKIYQTAFQDPYSVPIILPNVTYSVRVAARCPSGIQAGTLKIALEDFNQGIGFGTEYGSFEVDLTEMSSNVAVFVGKLLTTPFINTVSAALQLTLEVLNLGNGADCEIDRLEVFPTEAPYLKTQVYGSYLNNLEAIDASGDGGIIDTSTENSQDCMGAAVMHDNLYLLKSNSLYFTQDDSDSEPSGWGLHEVSNKVGTVGINSYDFGEEWILTACRAGIYGFNGGQPVKLMQEIWNVWEKINWEGAGNTIVLRNDLINRRILCAVPLPTPNQWLPFDPINPNPTSPNVMLMCNYQGINNFEELVNSPEVHTTMFGTLSAVDMKRKWSIWRIPSPYMDFIARQGGENDRTLFVGNGINSSKIYEFLDDQLSDDGVAINGLYTTYGFVNATKAATLPIFGFHAKRYTLLQFTVNGAGDFLIKGLSNTLLARYPYSVPTFELKDPAYDDWIRNLNLKGNRCFLQFSTNAVGAWFQLHKVLLSGKVDMWSPINPTGGGNMGYPN